MEEKPLHIRVDFMGIIELLYFFPRKPSEVVTLFLTADERLAGIADMGAVDEIDVIMLRFVAFRTRGNSLEEKSEWFFQDSPFVASVAVEIFLVLSEDLDVETGFLLHFSCRGLIGYFVRVYVSPRGHPTLEALMPEEERTMPLFIDDDRGGGEVTVH